MKRMASATLCVAMALIIVACGGNENPTDNGGTNDVQDVTVTDVNQDTSPDDVEDIRADEGSDTNHGDTVDVTTDQGMDTDDAHTEDMATDEGSELEDAGDNGTTDTTVEPICENALLLEPGQRLAVDALPEATPSIWATYSCDPDYPLEGPERVFFCRG